MYQKQSGQPVVGYISLTNGAPGPLAVVLTAVAGGGTFALAADDRVVITNIEVTTNDTAIPLVTLDDGPVVGAAASRKLGVWYATTTLPIAASIPPGNCQGRGAQNPRFTASAITAAKTVECIIRGYVTKTV